MATHRWEYLKLCTYILNCLHFGCEPHRSICTFTPVKRTNAHGISRDSEMAVLVVHQHEHKNAILLVNHFIGDFPLFLVPVAK